MLIRWRPDDRPMTSDPAPKSIDLAEEAAFALAGAEVRPATLEVISGERRELLEPRVMQVLVALARRRGEMVSRDELIAQCWGGRIVGEDAITRALAQLRKLAKSLGGFEIETIPRVGVRLVEGAETPPAARGSRRSTPLFLALGVLALVLLGVAFWAWRNTLSVTADEPVLAVRTFEAIGDDPQPRAFAQALTDEVRGVLGEAARGYVIQSPDGPMPEAGMVIRGTVARDTQGWRVRASLEDRATNVTIWSEPFEAAATEGPALRDQIAVALANVAYAATEPSRQVGSGVDAVALGLHVTVSRAVSAARPEQGFRIPNLSEEVVARAPRFAAGRAVVALHQATGMRSAPPEERPAIAARARKEATEALRLNAHTAGGAYDALYMLARFEQAADLAAAENILLQGIKVAPEHPWLQMRECRFLIEVGRSREAITYCERARALHPLNPPIDAAYADALYAAGQFAAATEAADRSARFHPTHLQSLRVQYELAAYYGDTARARAMLEAFRRPPVALPDESVRTGELFFAARNSGSVADIDRVVAAIRARSADQRFDPRAAVFSVARLGRVDEAFRLIDEFGATVPPNQRGFFAYILLERPAEALWRDARFWPAAARAGYVRYWLERDKWPDFCGDRGLPFDCKQQARRVAHIQPG